MINGIINVNKPAGYTSFDVVARMRGICHQKKIGHTGTLDPDAIGVLPVCLGNATRVCELLTDRSKTYETVLRLGITTDTQDISGSVLKERPVTSSLEDVKRVAFSFVGGYDQIPPMYSAKKVNGQRLYELARKGVEIERKACPVDIYEIEITDVSDFEEKREISMKVMCSKGTYIRTLCNDIGEKLGCGGTMMALKRTAVGPFVLADAITLEKLQEMADEGRLSEAVMSVDSVFMQYEKAIVCKEGMKFLMNGNQIPAEYLTVLESNRDTNPNEISDGDCFRMYDESDSFFAVYKYDAIGHCFMPVKMFLP